MQPGAMQAVKATKVKGKGDHPTISESDYFLRATEYRIWLSSTKGLFLQDMESKQARKIFKKFVKAWNEGLLSDQLYKGIASSGVEANSLTRHKWKFASKLTEQEKWQMATERDRIDSQGRKASWAPGSAGASILSTGSKAKPDNFREGDWMCPSCSAHNYASKSSCHKCGKPKPQQQGPSRGPQGPSLPGQGDTQLSWEQEKKRLKLERKRHKAHNDMVMEELVPKKEGREARIEKKKEKGAYTRPDQEQGGMGSFSESDLMGSGGSSDFQAALARQKNRRARYTDKKQQAAQEARDKESARMEAFKAQMAPYLKFQK